jgi:hypothetical protein|tara:strand:- start:13044 stop:13502 length:459 start_codon:yes stop_codon:yes gene_type:complete
MTQVYDLLDKIKDELRANNHVNTVSFGDITEVNLDKTDIFPITHLNISNAVIDSQSITFTLQILCADIIDYNKEQYSKDVFYGNNNLQDVLNTQLQVMNLIFSKLKRGNLRADKLQVDDTMSCQPFKERFENELAGWEAEVDIVMINDISIC